MQPIPDAYPTAYRLPSLLDELSAVIDPDFDTGLDDLEREFAEIRLGFGNANNQ